MVTGVSGRNRVVYGHEEAWPAGANGVGKALLSGSQTRAPC